MKPNLLIYSDVLMDFLVDRNPFAEKAEQILRLTDQRQIEAFITPLIISNLYYLLRKSATHQKVLSKLKMLLRFLHIVSMDEQVVLKALDSDFNDFEDALQSMSAEMSKVEIIVTRNVKDYKHSSLTVFTPGDFLASQMS